MRKGLVLLIAIIISIASNGQDKSLKPTRISKAVYFDQTPPLRDMPVVEPGVRDRSWKDGIIENPSLDRDLVSDEVRAKFHGVVDPVIQGKMGDRSSRGPLKSFDGVGNVNSCYPPDTDGDVGPNHYFQMINLSFAIYDKSGNKLYGPADNRTLWAGFIGPWTGTNDGDPMVMYDHLADRWVASQFAIYTSDGTYWELVAVSQTGDPLGSYNRYAFQFSDFNDYPKLSVWPDGYYSTYNMFGDDVHASVAAFEREKMLAGDPDAQMVYFDVLEAWSMMPADLDGPVPAAGTPNYLAALDTWNDQSLDIYSLQVDWSNTENSTLTEVASLDTDPFNPDIEGISQPETGTQLDAISDRLMNRLQYRKFADHETMVINHTVNVSNHAGIRWYEMRKDAGNWYIYQQGTYSPDAENRWMGSVAINANGTIALGYTVSSSTTHPSVRYTGRSADAPLGEMNFSELELMAGTGSQSGIDRWGDYSCMTVDPIDDTTFWYTQEYMGGGWRTRIGQFNFAPMLPPHVEAGSDTSMCENTLFTAHASGEYISSVLWSTSGDGRFIPDPPVAMNQVYIRGIEDIATGGFTLWIDANGFLPSLTDQDSIAVIIIRLPECNAGADTTICNDATITLDGSAADASSVFWTTAGDGTFDNNLVLNPTYTPGAGDIEAGSVKLTLTANPLALCEETAEDKITITLVICSGIDNTNIGKTGIKIIPNPSKGEFTLYLDHEKSNSLQVVVLNQLGEVVMNEEADNPSGHLVKTFKVSGLPKGIYFLKVQGGNSVYIEKVVIN
ncbi:MAG: T9SS type A sorting domain-containing protein [Bacteroidetes bacterium]|nr:T9SS type A sorting domain-containing protein [Bacteroidota bacterium]